MKAEPCPVGARLYDSLQYSQGGTVAHARALRAVGYDGFVGYLGSVTPKRLADTLNAGLGFMPVTYGGQYDGARAVKACQGLGLPAGVTVWLDVEGPQAYAAGASIIPSIDAWADAVAAAGYTPGLYLGAPQPLTPAELHALHVVRYWHGQGRCVDRTGALAEPRNGWCMTQMYPSISRGGVLIDANIVGQDYRGRVPVWAVR